MNTGLIDELMRKLYAIDEKINKLKSGGGENEINKYKSYRKAVVSAIVKYKLSEYGKEPYNEGDELSEGIPKEI